MTLPIKDKQVGPGERSCEVERHWSLRLDITFDTSPLDVRKIKNKTEFCEVLKNKIK